MDTIEKIKNSRARILYTFLVVVLLIAVIFTMVGHIYKFSEAEAFEKLHLETLQIKSDMNLQMLSDRENLQTMANFAAKLYTDGESFDLLFSSFKEIGLIENIGILLPSNRFLTKRGEAYVRDMLSFSEEKERGTYISGRVKDITNPEREVVRSAVPIVVNGETVAVLYGVIELETLLERYRDDAEAVSARLLVLEGGNGNYIVDTMRNHLGNITALAAVPYKTGFSYETMITDLTEGNPGYAAFQALSGERYEYAHYAPLVFDNWRIMLVKSEDVVFAGARATTNYMVMMLTLVIVIMIVYLLLVFTSESRKMRMNACASTIRKRLLEIFQQFTSIGDVLETIVHFSGARSAFFIDTDGEDYNYILPVKADELLSGEDRRYFISQLLKYINSHRKSLNTAVYIICNLSVNGRLEKENKNFYDFLQAHKLHKICFSVIMDNRNNMSILGVINAKNRSAYALLKDIAVCFSMAVHNKKYLDKIEAMTLIDPLTGISNRMTYKQDIKCLQNERTDFMACIYIDVLALHDFNDTYGYAAGDQMLIHIADVLHKAFADCRVYRMGGDEFLVIAEKLPREIIEERLRQMMLLIEEMKYHVSIGIQYGDASFGIEEMVTCAEKAMYEQKEKSGRG